MACAKLKAVRRCEALETVGVAPSAAAHSAVHHDSRKTVAPTRFELMIPLLQNEAWVLPCNGRSAPRRAGEQRGCDGQLRAVMAARQHLPNRRHCAGCSQNGDNPKGAA